MYNCIPLPKWNGKSWLAVAPDNVWPPPYRSKYCLGHAGIKGSDGADRRTGRQSNPSQVACILFEDLKCWGAWQWLASDWISEWDVNYLQAQSKKRSAQPTYQALHMTLHLVMMHPWAWYQIWLQKVFINLMKMDILYLILFCCSFDGGDIVSNQMPG